MNGGMMKSVFLGMEDRKRKKSKAKKRKDNYQYIKVKYFKCGILVHSSLVYEKDEKEEGKSQKLKRGNQRKGRT